MSTSETNTIKSNKSGPVTAYLEKLKAREMAEENQIKLQEKSKEIKNREFAEIGRLLSQWASELRNAGNNSLNSEIREPLSKQHHIVVQGEKIHAGNYDDDETIYLMSGNALVTFAIDTNTDSPFWRIKNHKSMNGQTKFTSEELAQAMLNEPMDRSIFNAKKMY